MLKVFIKKSQLANPSPPILASYDEASPVPEGAHGDDTVNFLVLEAYIRNSDTDPPIPHLIEGWRNVDSGLGINPVVHAEAQRRIKAVFPIEQQIATVHELVEMLLKYGPDQSHWPGDAGARVGQIARLWNYVRDVNDRAASHKSVPSDPTSDANWPTRIT